MKIFIASSRESLDLVREIEVWLKEQGHEPISGDKPGLFIPGEQTFKVLMEISRNVESAVFVFGTDDRVWYRGDTVPQPRDNVLIEYGLFAGVLGPKKAIVCRDGDPRHPVDLAGLTYIDVGTARRARGKLELTIWARRLTASPTDPTILRLLAKVTALEREKEELGERLAFERDKAVGLESILSKAQVVDFSSVNLSQDGHWKLLFKYEYFQDVASHIAGAVQSPVDLKALFARAGDQVVDAIAWHSPGDPDRRSLEMSPNRNLFLTRKLRRRIRDYAGAETYATFIAGAPVHLRGAIDDAGMLAVAKTMQE